MITSSLKRKDDDMRSININQTIYQLVQKEKEIESILFDLGFKDIVKPGMLNTVGRFMTLKQGSQLKKIPLELIISTLKEKGFDITEE